MPLHYILLVENLVESSQLLISVDDSLRAILVHRLERRRVWTLDALATRRSLSILLGPVNLLCPFRFLLLGTSLGTGAYIHRVT